MQLADWHWKIGHDSHSARLAYEKIISLFPHSAQAAQAAQYIENLNGMGKISQKASVTGLIKSSEQRDIKQLTLSNHRGITRGTARRN